MEKGLVLTHKGRDLGARCKILGFLGIALARLRAEPIPHLLCRHSSESMQFSGVSQELLGWWQSLFPALDEASEREELV